MKLLHPRHQAALQSAVHRIHDAAREAAASCVESLGAGASAAGNVRDRDRLLAAQFELNRKLPLFTQTFSSRFDERVKAELEPSNRASGAPGHTTHWETLSLVDDSEVEAGINADRFGLTIEHACEWELRELDAYIGALLQLGRPDRAHNPLRPELVGKSLAAAVAAVAEQTDVRQVLAAQIGRGLSRTMPRVYGEIVAELRDSGVQPVSLALRTVQGPGNELGINTSGYDSGASSALMPEEWSAPGPRSPSPGQWQASGGRAASGSPAGMVRGGTPIGEVNPDLMPLLRQLAQRGRSVGEGRGGDAPWRSSGSGFSDTVGDADATSEAEFDAAPTNLIHAHRDALRRVSAGTWDHRVIDVVGELFEQILSDPKVPPQMARQLARLQLPVLRVALGDASFFSSQRHPVRRFVNRIASLGCAFEDLETGPGQQFLSLVRELVQDIVGGDFDQMRLYEQELFRLETFIAERARQQAESEGSGAASLLEAKETDLLLQQRYMQQLRAALQPVAMQAFLREFLAQVWSQAITHAVRHGDADGVLAARLRRAGRDLVMSVQPKGSPADRKNFLMLLPHLMKDLTEGMALIGWPEPARKAFFGQLLPAHAESLKGQSLRPLDHNLLVKQIDAIFGVALPGTDDLAPGANAAPALDEVAVGPRFSGDEAQRIGLVEEAAVNWNGVVDIDLSAQPEVAAVERQIDGLPQLEPTPPPVQGESLVEQLQLGCAYQMHLQQSWQKVRLGYISPGRAFFLFQHGAQEMRTLTMTARMLMRMSHTGRLKPFEPTTLLERATARARQQLASLSAEFTRH
jgi:Protein of unknown function (DUF1631)